MQASVLHMVVEYLEHPIRNDRAKILPARTTVSAIRLWPTVLVYNTANLGVLQQPMCVANQEDYHLLGKSCDSSHGCFYGPGYRGWLRTPRLRPQ